jgi:NAD(P)-dependent dehydrogenase (short-subunit alcohol dehydrogenase family)
MEDKEKKIAIVTGAASGIGAATAELLASNGINVVIADYENDGLADEVVSKIISAGYEAESMRTDVSDYESVEKLFNEVVGKYGKVDILVNNAGIINKTLAKTAEHSLEDWDRVVAINQTGVFYCMKLALGQMMKQGSGNIVNVASLAGLKASGNNLAYSASKFAVVGMTKSAALEYGNKNIRINAVCPSYTKSQLLNSVLGDKPDLEKKILAYVPMNRFGEASEIAEAILWLATDKSKFVTGHCLTLDGGLSL